MHGVQAPRADVLGALVHVERDLGDAPHAVRGELERARLRSPAAPCTARVSEASGSVRMRTKSSTLSASSSTRIGRRPCSSGIRSDGFDMWKAPDAMNSTWSVFTMPYLVRDRAALDQRQQVALHAFARDVARRCVSARRAILSISSMNTMPFCSALLQRLTFSSSSLMSLAGLLLGEQLERLGAP